MEDNRIETLLLQLVADVAFIKSKLDTIDELRSDHKKLGERVDHMEADIKEGQKSISSLERRCNEMEKWNRDVLVESNKTKTSIFISAGLAIFGAILSLITNLL